MQHGPSGARENPLAADLDHILAHTSGLWDELRGQRLFITGGTGFFGCWLLESFTWANDRLGLGTSAVVLTRDPEAFRRKAPHLAFHPAVQLHQGDVRSFSFPEGTFSHVIHAATEASSRLNAEQPLVMFDTIVEGTRRVLECARACSARKFLLTSSGAVYGKQPPELTNIPEDYAGGPDPADPASAYGEGKRAAELLCALYAREYGLQAKIARCFAFVGPYLPLDAHFAIGNFIKDGLQGGPTRVLGDGTPFRSYLYAADLAIWLWTILMDGASCRPYNVGSERQIDIAGVARTVADAFRPRPIVEVARQRLAGHWSEHYVPCTQRAQAELHVEEHIALPDAVARTAAWCSLTIGGSGRLARKDQNDG
jgi:nucleoside-diphosphate-sugar epimerase